MFTRPQQCLMSLHSQILTVASQGGKEIQIFCVRAVRTFQQNKSILLQYWCWQFLNGHTFKPAE